MVIDTHVHLYPPEVATDPAAWAIALREPLWAQHCARVRRNGKVVQTFPDVARLLRDMDVAGVQRVVLQGWYWQNPTTCAWQNRFYASLVRAHPDRLSAFACFHAGAGEAAVRAELTRAFDEGLIGLGELSPHSQGVALDDPALGAALALAAERELPVMLHVTEPVGGAYPGRVHTPLADFQRLVVDHPQVTFILAHWGGLLPLHTLNPVAKRAFARTWWDTAASPLLYTPEVWRRVVDAVGAERVLLGSDYPLVLYPETAEEPGWPRLLEEAGDSGLTTEELAGVLGGNAGRLLKLS